MPIILGGENTNPYKFEFIKDKKRWIYGHKNNVCFDFGIIEEISDTEWIIGLYVWFDDVEINLLDNEDSNIVALLPNGKININHYITNVRFTDVERSPFHKDPENNINSYSAIKARISFDIVKTEEKSGIIL